MPIYHFEFDQYSEEYGKKKLGLPTASNFHKILTPKGKPSDQWQNYAYHLIAERILSRQVDTYTSPQMENGLEMEPVAVSWYECANDIDTKVVGFVTNDEATIGCSPDRLVGEDGILQIKCPMPHTQVRYWLEGKLEDKHLPQLQGELFVTGRKWVDIVSWHPELPRITIRVERDEVYIACLNKLISDFNEFIISVMSKIKESDAYNKKINTNDVLAV